MTKKSVSVEIPYYCKKCPLFNKDEKCINADEVDKNLKIVNNTGYTHDVYCSRRQKTVYGI